MTREKKSVTTAVACSVGKVCTYTLLMTVCSTSNSNNAGRISQQRFALNQVRRPSTSPFQIEWVASGGARVLRADLQKLPLTWQSMDCESRLRHYAAVQLWRRSLAHASAHNCKSPRELLRSLESRCQGTLPLRQECHLNLPVH